jgi:hypothetical protein
VDYLYGLAGNDTITGNGGGDFIIAGQGADIITPGAGDNIIDMGDGTFDGTPGDKAADVLIVSAVVGSSSDSGRHALAGNGSDTGADFVYNFEFALDTLRVVATNVGSFNHLSAATVGTAGAANNTTVASFDATTGLIDFNSNGSIDNGDIAVTFRYLDTVAAFSEAAFEARVQYVLTGTGGADVIATGGLDDTITGGAGNDIIDGGDGHDLIIGGQGADVLSGGTGRDTFKYQDRADSNSSAMDIVKDFTFGNTGDFLDVSVIDGSGRVGYSKADFTSLDALQTFAMSSMNYVVSGPRDVFVGKVGSDVYVLAHTTSMVDWKTDNSSSSIVKFEGAAGSFASIDKSNFVSSSDLIELKGLRDISSGNSLGKITDHQVLVQNTNFGGAEEMPRSSEPVNIIYVKSGLASNNLINNIEYITLDTDLTSKISTLYGFMNIGNLNGVQKKDGTEDGDNPDIISRALNRILDPTTYKGAKVFVAADTDADYGESINIDKAGYWFWNDAGNGNGNGIVDFDELTLIAFAIDQNPALWVPYD